MVWYEFLFQGCVNERITDWGNGYVTGICGISATGYLLLIVFFILALLFALWSYDRVYCVDS